MGYESPVYYSNSPCKQIKTEKYFHTYSRLKKITIQEALPYPHITSTCMQDTSDLKITMKSK